MEKVGSGNKSERISDQLTTRGHVLSHRGRSGVAKTRVRVTPRVRVRVRVRVGVRIG